MDCFASLAMMGYPYCAVLDLETILLRERPYTVFDTCDMTAIMRS
jgi:hypothetical protein